MTPDEITTEWAGMTPRERNVAVAVKVLEWTSVQWDEGAEPPANFGFRTPRSGYRERIPDYIGTYEGMGMVKIKIRELGWSMGNILRLDGTAFADACKDGTYVDAGGNTEPEAVALAAYLAVETE